MTKPIVVFAGSGSFAVPILKSLLKIANVPLVVTQPARPAGKGKQLRSTPIYDTSLALELNVVTPDNLEATNDDIANIKPDVMVVTDYGAMVKQSTLHIPKFGVINIHPSLLPKYRGPSPVQSTLLNGDSVTGVTVMLIDEKMDHGPILDQVNYSIPDGHSALQLEEALAELGAERLAEVLPKYISGGLSPIEQNHSAATFCKLIKKTDGVVTSTDTVQVIKNKVRALQPWPGVWITENGKEKNIRLNIIKTGAIFRFQPTEPPLGLCVNQGKLLLHACDGSVEILEIKPEGKQVMDAKSFINGYLTAK